MSSHDLISLGDLAQRVGCRVVLVRRFFHLGVIEEAEVRRGDPYFGESAVERLHRALRIRQDLRVGSASLGLVLDLLERIEHLEAELERRQ